MPVLTANCRDVTRWMRTELRNGEHIDPLTGIANTTSLAEAAADAFGHAEEGGWLDDPDHWVWEAALAAAEAEGAGDRP